MPEKSRSGNGNAVETEIEDADGLDLVLPGAQWQFSRADGGADATQIRSRFYRGVSGHEMDFGFTVLAHGQLDNSTLIVGTPTATGPTPSLWDGVELAAGDVRVFGPGTMPHASDAAGLRLEVLCIDYKSLREAAEVLGLDIGDWENRKAWLDGPGWRGRSILAAGSELDPDGDAGALLSSVALALSLASFDAGSRRMLSSSQIVGRSFEYLDATGSWFPPIVDLCRAAWVSERRLRQAFVDCFDRPPSQVLRLRALTAVRQALRDSPSHDASVSNVAISHGFRHLGNFARYYRAAFGETPSQTLAPRLR